MSESALTFSDLSGRKVGIWGFGVEGRATLSRLHKLGINPYVIVDDAPHADEAHEVLATTSGGIEALFSCDVVIKSPGVSRYRHEVKELEDGGVVVMGGVGLWLNGIDRSKVIAITGSKGKSTTSSLTHALLQAHGRKSLLAGNIGVVAWDPINPDASEFDDIVVELSSYQVTDVVLGPRLVVLTSLSPDHLDWHGGVANYYDDKLSLCRKPDVEVVLANGDDKELRSHEATLGENLTWISPLPFTHDVAVAFHLQGIHNEHNAALSLAILEARGIHATGAIVHACAKEFTPLPSRLSLVARSGGVQFIDDGLATNVLPTASALAAYPQGRLVLLVGGQDRGIDYHPLADALENRPGETALCTLPDNGHRIHKQIVEGGWGGVVKDFEEIDECVAWAAQWVGEEGVVLLSPAAPSYGRYRNYQHRGEMFLSAAKAWAHSEGRPFTEI